MCFIIMIYIKKNNKHKYIFYPCVFLLLLVLLYIYIFFVYSHFTFVICFQNIFYFKISLYSKIDLKFKI